MTAYRGETLATCWFLVICRRDLRGCGTAAGARGIYGSSQSLPCCREHVLGVPCSRCPQESPVWLREVPHAVVHETTVWAPWEKIVPQPNLPPRKNRSVGICRFASTVSTAEYRHGASATSRCSAKTMKFVPLCIALQREQYCLLFQYFFPFIFRYDQHVFSPPHRGNGTAFIHRATAKLDKVSIYL